MVEQGILSPGPPLLTVTAAPLLTVTAAPLLTVTAADSNEDIDAEICSYSLDKGLSVEISLLGIPPAGDLLRGGETTLLVTDSKSCSDLRSHDSTPQHFVDHLIVPDQRSSKSTSLPNHPNRTRRLSPNTPQGGAVFLNHQRRKQKSFDISMLSHESDELGFLSRARSPSPNPSELSVNGGNKIDFCEYVVEEILVTEQQYLRDLEDIVLGYLDCSRKSSHITEQDIVEIFANIEEIYNFHNSFLTELESCDDQPVAIAKCFIDHGAEFGIYAKYVTNYPSSITCLTRLLRNVVVNDAYRKQQLILGHGLPLGSYLHKPVQRILKYHLLLQNMLKHFPEDTFGRETITTSLHCMTDCAHNINELKRSHEDAMKIQEIQSMLYNFEGYNLLDFGKLVIEGDLRMHGAKSFRHVYLFEKGVIICKKREDGAMSCKTSIMCHNLMLIESIPREPLSFHLVPYDNPRLQNTLQAKTLEQKRQWCSLVKKYILDSYDVKIPDKAKELLLTLTGKSESDEKFAKQYKAFTLKAHQTPDYIERKRRKSQPYMSTSAGETLPRIKKRVRKASADPRMSLTPDLFMTPPMLRMTRSMSNPVTPLDLSTPSPLLTRSITSSVAEEPDIFDLDMSQSSLFDTHSSLHESLLENDKSLLAQCYGAHHSGADSEEADLGLEFIAGDTRPSKAQTTITSNINVQSSREVSKIDLTQIPRVEITDTDLTESTGADNSNSQPIKAQTTITSNIDVQSSREVSKIDLTQIPRVEITDTDLTESTGADNSNSQPIIGALGALNAEKTTPNTTESNPASIGNHCMHIIQRPVSSEGGLYRELYPSQDSPSVSPVIKRRHSLTDLSPCKDKHETGHERSHDESSPRAKLLHRLLEERQGLDNPIWCPEVRYATRRYSTIPALRRSDSYAQAQAHGGTLVVSVDSLLDSDQSPSLSRHRASLSNSRQGSMSSSELLDQHSPQQSDSDTIRKTKTETSMIINKLSQLKERTSSKLSDLLKKSPVRLFKDSTTDSIDIERNDLLTTQNYVGRRLSHVEVITPDDSPVHHCADTSHNHTVMLPTFCDSGDLDCPHSSAFSEEKTEHIPHELSCEEDVSDEIPPVPPRCKNLATNRHSVHSLTSNSGSLERNATSKQSYSSDNLADVEENEYVNVDFGDNMTLQVEISHNKSDDSDSVCSRQSLTGKQPVETDDETTEKTPPELPPHPEHILKERLTKTLSGLDDTLTSLDELSRELKSDLSSNRHSLPTNLKLNKPASDFWVALEKYMETGQIEQSTTHQIERPTPKSEPATPLSHQAVLIGDDQPVELNKLSTGNTVNRQSKVYKMARKYSTRIRSTKADGFKRLQAMRERLSMTDSAYQEEDTSGVSDTGVLSLTTSSARRIDSVRLKRTNSSRVRKFKVILDSDEEQEVCSKADSGVTHCDFDSGSDCNDIYERQTMAALESFGSDDEMRDSAIYSDGEESGITSPLLHQNRKTMTPVMRARTMSPSRDRRRKVRTTRHHSFKENESQSCSKPTASVDELIAESRGRRCKSLPRCNSLPPFTTSELTVQSVDDIISRPVSSNILVRLAALKKSSTFTKDTSTDKVSSGRQAEKLTVQQITRSLCKQTENLYKRASTGSLGMELSKSNGIKQTIREDNNNLIKRADKSSSSSLVCQVKQKLQVI